MFSDEVSFESGVLDSEEGRERTQVGFSLKFCFAKSSDFGSALFKYYINVQVFNVQLN